ncbi:MAG: hypothetical protein V4717_16040 [Bacteroidota bacterium]
MKKFYTLVIACLYLNLNASAKIWRVNNNTGVIADFSTIQAANDGASSGDTIHIEPSINSYGELTINKRLTIISTGQFLSDNPGFQFDTKAPFVNSINISNAAANNTILMVRYAGNININSGVSGILISNCASTTANGNSGCTAGQIIINNADNITIKNSWASNIQCQNNSNNIVIANNIIGNLVAVDISSDGIIANNVIHAIAGGACGANDQSINNCVVGNNIFNSQQNATFSNCTISNNLAPAGNLPAGNGNLTNVDMTTVFVNNAGGFVDNVYQLKPGSPAIGAGGGGIDCGAFGGGSPFKLAVTPPIPSIYKMSIPATPAGSSMTLTFSTRSNN